MKNIIIYILVLVLLVIGGVFAFEYNKAKIQKEAEQNQVVCAMDAKVCPDGSYVGRGGPVCAFAECPAFTATSTATTTATSTNVSGTVAKLGQTVTIDGISITPISITEESRCPTDVQCIQAGTVIIKAKLSSDTSISETSLKLGNAISFSNKYVTLDGVIPKPNTKFTTKDSDYSFSFSVTRSATKPVIIIQ